MASRHQLTTRTDRNLAQYKRDSLMDTATKKILSVSKKILPEINPTAIRSSKTLQYLPEDWHLHILSGCQNVSLNRAKVHCVQSWQPDKLLRLLRIVKLGKLLDWFVWPDEDIFWLIPAVLKGKKVIYDNNVDLIVVFLKPYSAGIIGILLKWLTGKPLVINVCEPSTCDDLYAVFPTKLHYYLDRWLEDFYVRQSDAIVYVSQLSLEIVRSRQPQKHHSKFHLLRGGADPQDFLVRNNDHIPKDDFDIVFTGGMTGWEDFLQPSRQHWVTKLRQAWMNLGRYHNFKVRNASSSPVFIGRAIKQLVARHPEWTGKIRLSIYGNKFEQAETVLKQQNISEVVRVVGAVPYFEATQKLQHADLLFMPLPDRIDNTPGDRISLKTYEYLMTEKPVLAAVPLGENRNYLRDKPGVYLVAPTDVEAMSQVIFNLFSGKQSGELTAIDRTVTHQQISYVKRGEELANLFLAVLEMKRLRQI